MKKLLFVICLLITLIACKKEVSDLQTGYFTRFYGDALDDFGSDIELTADGGFIIAGNSQRKESVDSTDIILITTDKYGYQNTKTVYFGESGDEKCAGLLVLDDGYVVTGSITDSSGEKVLLEKFGLDGVHVWSTGWISSGKGLDIALINNQIVIAGYIAPEGQKIPMICSFDLLGNKLDLFAPTDNPGDYFTSLEMRNNKAFGFGTSLKNPSNTDMFIIGASTDIGSFPLPGNETSAQIISSKDGGFFIVGTTDPIGSGFNQIVVNKINDDFSVVDTLLIGSDADYRGVDIQLMADGSVAVLGDKTLSKDTDIVLFILEPDGTMRSSKIYGKTGNQSASSLKITPDGGLIILGSNQQEKTNSMITLIKTDKDGNIWE